jgi:NADPH2:quinone reductase
VRAVQYARYGGPEVLDLVELPDPRPAEDGVLIRVHAAGVAPGDCKVRAGHLQAMFPVTLPKIPGRDGAGTVVAKGPRADYARIGDAVCFIAQHVEQGSAAELIARRRGEIAAMPVGLSFIEAASLAHAGMCAWIGIVETAAAAPGMKLLVHGGAGAIGALAIQIARHRGAEVAATCRTSHVERVRALGADPIIAYDREDFAARLASYDAVFDLVGGEVHRRSLSVLRRGGTIVWLYAAPFRDEAAAFGVASRRAVIDDRIETLGSVLDLAARGVLKPQVGRVLPMARCAEAHRLVEAGGHGGGRIVLEVA